MIKFVEADGTLTAAEPRIHQHAREIQANGRIVRTPIALSNNAAPEVLFIAADRDHHAGRLDAVAGGEFLDDRIRLRE